MRKLRINTCFNSTIEVPEDCTDEVAFAMASKAIEQSLECLDGCESHDCRVTGVNSVESEGL